MGLNPTQKRIVEQLIRQEEMVSELYGLFAKQFSEYASFWKELSLEEVRHAKLLKELKEAANKEQVLFDEGKLTINTLDVFLVRLDDVLQKAKKGEFTLLAALNCAADYEISLIEKDIFSHFDSSHKKFREVLQILQAETLKHVELVTNIQRSVAGIIQ